MLTARCGPDQHSARAIRPANLDGKGITTEDADPKVKTLTDYSQKSTSPLHTHSQGMRDPDFPGGAHAYLVVSNQHAGHIGFQPDLGPCANPRNRDNPLPALSALILALDQSATLGVAPPTRVPSIANGTLVSMEAMAFP
jgi:hypothetical protein